MSPAEQLRSSSSSGEAVAFTVKVTPKSSRDELLAPIDGVWRIKVTAAPENGKANEAVRRLLAEILSVPLRAIVIESGAAARLKRVRVIRS